MAFLQNFIFSNLSRTILTKKQIPGLIITIVIIINIIILIKSKIIKKKNKKIKKSKIIHHHRINMAASVVPNAAKNAIPNGFSPKVLCTAYSIPSFATPKIKPNVTVIIAYSYPNLQSDLNVFCSTFDIPPITPPLLLVSV